MIEEIKSRLPLYEATITDDLHYQMLEDISSLLILFDALGQSKIDLVKFKEQVDEILAKETKESLTTWLNNERNKKL